MTNQQIIADVAASIYGEDAVISMIENGQDIPLHTVKGWSARGPYRVKKGEKGIAAMLWRKRYRKGSSAEDESQSSEEKGDFYKSKAYLFCAEQVELVEKDK